MPEAGRLAQLAARHGIVAGYHDIWGQYHAASDATLRSLLGAMGVDASSDAAIDDAVAAHERDRWGSMLPPAVVVRRSALPGEIEVRVPDRLGTQRLSWRIDEEEGGSHAGTFVPNELEVGEWADVDEEHYVARRLPIATTPALGYHSLAITLGERLLAQGRLIVVPDRCHHPAAIEGTGRVWGPAVQLYAVRSDRNWGIGDFTDLLRLVEQWGGRGAGIVGVSPLHALHPHNAAHASPYSPSSRLFFNVLHLDVEAIDDFGESASVRALVRSPSFATQLARLRHAPLVDYPGIAAAKRTVLEALYDHFRARHLAATETARGAAFRAFQARGGERLRRQGLFDVLQERFAQEAAAEAAWPDAFRDPASPAVAAFAREAIERIEFFEYLQWQADIQLAAIVRRAAEVGLGVGLYQDLAVSVDRDGADVWADRTLYAPASVGAPPDDFALTGQDWGLPPMIPERMQAAAYEPFIAVLRANMVHAGALRIDHVMGLARLFWVPPGGRAADGAYVRYPFEDLLGLVALESHRNRCLVIGEDLGTVPDEVRAGLERTGILSYRLLYFERDEAGDFKPPREYPREALAACTTHDLPTLAGYWAGRDIALRTALGLFPSEEKRLAQIESRARDRVRLLAALEREGLLPPGSADQLAAHEQLTPEIACALHAYVARSPARIMVAQLEDVIGAVEQANLPGTVGEHPNWRRKLAVTLETFARDPRFLGLTDAIARERGGPAD